MPGITLLTGARGFVGSHLLASVRERGSLVRTLPHEALDDPEEVVRALAQVECVIHLAARVHVMREQESDPLAAFRRANRDATLALAARAAECGVRRFVFLSSIKVNGEASRDRPFRADDVPAPVDPYGISKWEAEQGLHDLAARTGLEVVVIRPSLVHGPGARGNLERLMRWVARGIPLPLGSVNNRRRLIGRDNLVDLILRAASHPRAAGATLLAGDAECVSTPELIRLIGRGLGVAPRLLPVPPAMLRLAGSLIGAGAEISRLVGSLDFDVSSTNTLLDWTPPMSLEAGIDEMARAWVAAR